MVVFSLLIGVIFCVALALMVHTNRRAQDIEKTFPPIGQFLEINGLKTHYIDKPADHDEAPVVVFLHGASGNLRDPYYAFADRLEGKVRQIFIDRPGHGWSERGSTEMHSPLNQTRHILAFLDAVNVEKVIFVGHSWSGTIAATLGVVFPKRVNGLLFDAPVTHPWPGGINWYYPVAALPVIGWFFTRVLTLPVGEKQIACATEKVFWPNRVPDYYDKSVGGTLVLTPSRFRANSHDIANLRPYVVAMHHRYTEIKAPVTVITGDKDQVVLPWVHCDGLEKKVPQIRRIDLKDTGHMPHHIHQDIFVEEILRLTNGVSRAASPQAAE